MAFTSSRTWISDEAREAEKWQATIIACRRICQHSPFIPWTLTEWLAHRLAITQARSRQMAKRAQTTADSIAGSEQSISLPFCGKKFLDNRSAVLLMPTIWCPNWNQPGRVTAPWPSIQEMRWEGDDRARTRVSRFLPLPREPANKTVAWHHKQMVPVEKLDEVWKVPTLEDIYFPVDEVDEKDVPQLLNSDLLAAMECDDIC